MSDFKDVAISAAKNLYNLINKLNGQESWQVYLIGSIGLGFYGLIYAILSLKEK